jgi:ankyrin repeat protein
VDRWKDDKSGHTFLQMRAEEQAWGDVERLLQRGADPNRQFYVDRVDGMDRSMLHRALESCQWKTAKLLIQFHADINKPEPFTSQTPVQMLIDMNRSDLVDEALFWGCDVAGGKTGMGKNALHAACQAGHWECMEYLMARAVDPLAVTQGGQSVLMKAVQNPTCPQRMVAECVRLGMSTYQPALIELRSTKTSLWSDVNVSPFLFALLHGLHDVSDMLYRSGAVSNRQLWQYYLDVARQRSFCPDVQRTLDHLEPLARNPRTLQSSCCLAISQHLGVGKHKHRAGRLLHCLNDTFSERTMVVSENKFGVIMSALCHSQPIQLRCIEFDDLVKQVMFDNVTGLFISEVNSG